MSSLEYAFRFFDQQGKGYVTIDEFKAGIRALNASVKEVSGKSAPLTDDQMEVLVGFIDKDGDGNVDYEEFLSAFKPKFDRFKAKK
mmetsp:Transcript_27872/g.43490  ORF Transcript_27872/g.43490 Transcript_27872/m.43490 type:complete len:86 (+) Transcript_27872:80-337(+)